jgi:DNA ligase-associated metallophosphoesterase
MKTSFPHRINEQQLWLSPERCIYWEQGKSLILSDLHFGKTGHFRKAGIAVPQSVYREDLQRLITQIQYFQPKRLIIVGDLFHSHANKELELFKKWRDDFPDIIISLVKGNHDILKDDRYAGASIKLHPEHLIADNFSFIHDITHSIAKEATDSRQYSFSGHIHPGIRINGAGKQSLSFPCFYFGSEFAVLPAFSRFTGVALIDPKSHESVFAIVDKKIMQLQ